MRFLAIRSCDCSERLNTSMRQPCISARVHLYQALAMSVWCSNVDPLGRPTWIHWRLSIWGVSDRYLMYAGGLMSPMQRCFSDLVCQPLVTSYVIDAYLWPCCTPGPWSTSIIYQHMMLCDYEDRKLMASWWRPPGRLRNVWFSKVQEDANAILLYTLWRSEIARGHWVAQQFTRTTRRRRWWWWCKTG